MMRKNTCSSRTASATKGSVECGGDRYGLVRRLSHAYTTTDRKFMKAYVEIVHHPLEDEGVDFWWMDWQQGSHSRTPGIDSLWLLITSITSTPSVTAAVSPSVVMQDPDPSGIPSDFQE